MTQARPRTGDVGQLLAGLLASHPVVDLTLPLVGTLPCTWPGHMPFRATVWSWFAARQQPRSPAGSKARTDRERRQGLTANEGKG